MANKTWNLRTKSVMAVGWCNVCKKINMLSDAGGWIVNAEKKQVLS
jgi:hypothetical protein